MDFDHMNNCLHPSNSLPFEDNDTLNKKYTAIKDLTENLIGGMKRKFKGKTVSVRGAVTYSSGIKLYASEITFMCTECNICQTLEFGGGKYYFPFKCKTLGCKSKEFTPMLEYNEETNKKEFADWQIIRLQEVWNGNGEAATIPMTIDCELRDELVDNVKPGDFVSVTGKLEVHEIPVNEKTKGSMMHHLYIDAFNIKKNIIFENFSCDCRENITNPEDTYFSLTDFYKIKHIIDYQSDDLFKVNNCYYEEFYWCIFTNLYSDIVAGILLAIFGGIDNSVINVLIVGDPGTDKTELLDAASKVAPHTVFIPITQANSSPLMPLLHYDKRSGDLILEAGSFIMSNTGICRIDDFEKINQPNALAEAISRRTISVCKAGVTCTLTARTKHQPAQLVDITKNLKIGNDLLSNFDLIFLLLDIPDEEMDHYLSERFMTVHSGVYPEDKSDKSQRYVPSTSDTNRSHLIGILPLSKRLKISTEDENMNVLPIPLLQKYIAYARKYVHPRLSQEAREMIKIFFGNMGHKYQFVDGTPITIRQLETMIRLSQARARMELRDVVISEDVEDDEFGNIRTKAKAKTVVRSGKQTDVKRFLSELQRFGNVKGNYVFTIQEMQEIATDSNVRYDNFQSFIDLLNDQSLILKKGPGTFQLRL
ncbi:17594_t:CDS:10 [Dentiscutata erythropus]|uniref:17594_t:CDS:1 n=1 Tax=Dentiscutata erythropus TaxID=1348616 RepID=A0A9N8Z1X6_9GLOM|nr:17594_t:CDS:10 [Dentiscutata erythropus]